MPYLIVYGDLEQFGLSRLQLLERLRSINESHPRLFRGKPGAVVHIGDNVFCRTRLVKAGQRKTFIVEEIFHKPSSSLGDPIRDVRRAHHEWENGNMSFGAFFERLEALLQRAGMLIVGRSWNQLLVDDFLDCYLVFLSLKGDSLR